MALPAAWPSRCGGEIAPSCRSGGSRRRSLLQPFWPEPVTRLKHQADGAIQREQLADGSRRADLRPLQL